jgi:DNA-binding transcriptional ArsR family regulator
LPEFQERTGRRLRQVNQMGSDRSATAVFGLLSDETRVDVLRAVAHAQDELAAVDAGPAALGFSEIYDRVDVDNTSKLSYHLGELTGTFLRKDEDGYSFTHAGERMVRFVVSGNYERPPDVAPTPTEGRCPFCGEAALRATLHHQFFLVECTACERPVSNYSVTPAQVRSLDGEDLVRSVGRKQAADYDRVRRGVCPECGGPLSTRIREVDEVPTPDADPFLVADRCSECLRPYNALLTTRVAYHPASVAFHWDRGVDVTAKGLWTFTGHLLEGRWTSERVATDPAEYQVVLRHDGDALRCRLDADAEVTRTERVRRG